MEYPDKVKIISVFAKPSTNETINVVSIFDKTTTSIKIIDVSDTETTTTSVIPRQIFTSTEIIQAQINNPAITETTKYVESVYPALKSQQATTVIV